MININPPISKTVLSLTIDDSAAIAPYTDYGTWETLHQFVGSDMILPHDEAELSSYLGNCYEHDDWSSAMNAVMKAECDAVRAQLTICIPAAWHLQVTTEKDLMASVDPIQAGAAFTAEPNSYRQS